MKMTTSHIRSACLVGFRLDPVTWDVLGAEAARQGINPAQLAKSYVVRGVHERADRDALLTEIFLLREEIRSLRAQYNGDNSAACEPALGCPAEDPERRVEHFKNSKPSLGR